jgi:hypothetical protein
MLTPVAASTEDCQVFGDVIAKLASTLQMMHLKFGRGSSDLAAPSVTIEDLAS